MKENKLDKFFREKSEENLPEFDPKYWEQAERMLDDALPVEEDSKRRAWWWWLPLLLIGGCGVCWFSPLGKDKYWAELDEKVLIDKERIDKQEENVGQINFENKITNTNSENKNASKITNEETAKTINSTTNNSNSLKNEIADIGQNDAPKVTSSEIFDKKSLTNLEANKISKELNKVPAETPEITSLQIDKAPDLTPVIPDEDSPSFELLPTLDADFLKIPLVEIEDSLTLDSTDFQDLLKLKKLRFGWSIGAVVRREPFIDSVSTTVASLRAGLTLDYRLSKKWDFHFDALVRRESRELLKTIDSEEQGGKAYGFGVTEITNLYRFKTQYFVEGVGLFRYKLNERHALGAGLGVKYLFSVRADIIQRNEEAEFNFNNYAVNFVNRDEIVESGWWEKEETQDLLPFAQLRYDYRTTRHVSLFFKINGEYNRTWYPGSVDDINFNERQFRLETSFGFNYQF